MGTWPPRGKLRIYMDGSWTVEEMASELAAVNFFYSAEALFLNAPQSVRGFSVGSVAHLPNLKAFNRATLEFLRRGRWSGILDHSRPQPLILSFIKYGSPGEHELAGVDRYLDSIFKMLVWLIDKKKRDEIHETEMKARRVKIAQEELKLKREWIGLMQEANVPAKTIRQVCAHWASHELVINSLVNQNKITAVVRESKD